MKSAVLVASIVILAMGHGSVSAAQKDSGKPLTDKKVKNAIIKESIASYPGNCPCPYSVARNGSSCGRHSAYSKPGGYRPICYDSDVNQEMIKEWRENHK